MSSPTTVTLRTEPCSTSGGQSRIGVDGAALHANSPVNGMGLLVTNRTRCLPFCARHRCRGGHRSRCLSKNYRLPRTLQSSRLCKVTEDDLNIPDGQTAGNGKELREHAVRTALLRPVRRSRHPHRRPKPPPGWATALVSALFTCGSSHATDTSKKRPHIRGPRTPLAFEAAHPRCRRSYEDQFGDLTRGLEDGELATMADPTR